MRGKLFKMIQVGLFGLGAGLILIGLPLAFNLLDAPISNFFAALWHRQPETTWPSYYSQIGVILVALGGLSLLSTLALRYFSQLKSAAAHLDARIARFVARLPSSEARLSAADRWPTFTWIDGAVMLLFLGYALVLFLASIQGNYPDLIISGDAGNTASFAAGIDHPELFKGDMLLNDPKNVQVYSTFNVFFMRLLFPLTQSYPLALSILIPVQAFFQLTGFYLFGRILFGCRIWGTILTILLSIAVPINLGETWGILTDPVARFNFQAFLPFVLCLVLVWRDKPSRWPWIMAATGIMFYLHPVSTPCWAVAIWLSLFFSTPREWKWLRRLGYMFVMGLIFLAVATPYVLTYFGSHVQGRSQNYALVYSIILTHFPENLLNIPEAVRVFSEAMIQRGILPGAILGFAALLILRRSQRAPLKIVLIWIGGIILMSVFVPFGMHAYERLFRLIPTETEMVRAIRYLIPFMWILIVWGAHEISLRIPRRASPNVLMNVALLVLVGVGVPLAGPIPTLQKASACLLQGQWLCYQPNDYDLVIQAAKTLVPPEQPIYVTFANRSELAYGIPFRYIALRPVVYTFKDRGMLVYSNDRALKIWDEISHQARLIDERSGNSDDKLLHYLDLAKASGAQYLIADLERDLPDLAISLTPTIYRNHRFAIFRVTEPAP